MALARVFLVHVISADPAVRAACRQALRELGYATAAFAEARDFIAAGLAHRPDCLVIDEGLPDGAAPALQRFAQDAERRIPVVCIAAHATAALAVRAMKAGAVDYLCLPVVSEDLAQAIATAVDVGRRWRDEDSRRSRARALVARLTPREQSVFALVLDGMLNKQIACCLGSSEATVKVHRSRLMRKLEVRSLVELLQLGHELGRAPHDARFLATGYHDRPRASLHERHRAAESALAPAGDAAGAWRQSA